VSHHTFDDPHGTSDRARQALLDNHSEHKLKRHRTLVRRKRISAKKRERIKFNLFMQKRERSRYLAKARAYWRGDADGHP
jgi:predicted ATPase